MEKIDEMMGLSASNEEALSGLPVYQLSALVNKLIEFRIEQNVTQETLAAKTGLKQSAIARFEAGLTIPRADTLFRYAAGVGAVIQGFLPKDKRIEYFLLSGGMKNDNYALYGKVATVTHQTFHTQPISIPDPYSSSEVN